MAVISGIYSKRVYSSKLHGCQIGSFGAKNQKFGSFEKQSGPKFYLAIWLLFSSFATFSFHKFFLEKSCEWCVWLVLPP